LEMNSDTLKLRAYHEAGHAVIAYFSGFSCNFLEITQKDPLSNRENYNFGQNTGLINAMNKYRDNPEFFDNIPKVVKINSRKMAIKTIIVLLAGQAAEKIYINGGKPVVNLPIDQTGEDIGVADNIDYFLSVVKSGQHPMNYLKIIFKQVAELISGREVWTSISMIAEALFVSSQRKLNQKEIEKMLHDTGYMDYLKKLKQKSINRNEPQKVNSTETSVSSDVSKGFSREELLKMKESMKNTSGSEPMVDKKEGVKKIAEFVKHMKLTNLYIGLAEDPKKFDKTSNNIILETHSNAVAKDILMYFICLGMQISPDSSKSKEASSVYVATK